MRHNRLVTDDIDWAAAHADHVAPHRAELRAGPPKAVLVVAFAAIGLGALLLAFVSSVYRLTGVVPLFAGVFVLAMLWRSRGSADAPAVVRRGVVTDLGRDEQVGSDSRGMSVRRVSLWVELELREVGELTELDPNLSPASGQVRLGLGEELFESLQRGEAITTLSLPGAAGHIRVLLARKIPASQPSN